uniref:C-type lectin domain-containing protein n=2 Tax=Myripristis murdjan TaxID=586833 RepID=A0A667WHY0_9TELE
IRRFRLLAACLGIICVLLVAAIITIIHFGVVVTEQRANLSNLTAQNVELRTEGTVLQRRIGELSREKEELNRANDGLNWTLGVIFGSDSFPVKKYCPQRGQCNRCPKGWLLFQESCYLFSVDDDVWRSWHDSRLFCQETAADLVIIGSLQEQEFINNHTEYYYNSRGFWIGLSKTEDNKWLWVDGSNQTLGYWKTEPDVKPNYCTLSIPGRDPTVSWDESRCWVVNKFICESKVLFKSD